MALHRSSNRNTRDRAIRGAFSSVQNLMVVRQQFLRGLVSGAGTSERIRFAMTSSSVEQCVIVDADGAPIPPTPKGRRSFTKMAGKQLPGMAPARKENKKRRERQKEETMGENPVYRHISIASTPQTDGCIDNGISSFKEYLQKQGGLGQAV